MALSVSANQWHVLEISLKMFNRPGVAGAVLQTLGGFFLLHKVVKLVDGGSVINRA